MNDALQNYRDYGVLIKEIKAERNQIIFDSLKSDVVKTGTKIGTFKRRKVDKLKQNLKDIDLRVRDVVGEAEEKLINTQIIVIDKYNRFKNNVVQVYNSTSDKIGKYKKNKIDKFKGSILNIGRDITNVLSKVEEKKIEAEIKVIKKVNRFKSNVIQYGNKAKNKVGSISRSAKNKISSMFMSDEVSRQNKIDEINERKRRIAELKEIRNQLLVGNDQSLESQNVDRGHSRGILYASMVVVISLLLFGVLIGISIIKR